MHRGRIVEQGPTEQIFERPQHPYTRTLLAASPLPEDGVFIVIEALIDDARRVNTFGLMMSLDMLLEFGDALDFTGEEFRSWCEEAGCRRFEVIPLAGPSSAAVAYE